MSLKKISFDVPAHQITAILGANGAGKSTLLKLLDGQYREYTGSIKFGDTEIRRISRNTLSQQIAYLPQIESVPALYDLKSYLLLGRSPYIPLWSAPGRMDAAVVENIIFMLGLKPLISKTVDKLSGGEWQRVRIGRALVQQPEMLLLDEPTTFLDLNHRRNILSLLKQLSMNKITILFATHDPEAAAEIADNLLIMKNGSLLTLGPIEHTLNATLLTRAFDLPLQVVKLKHRKVIIK